MCLLERVSCCCHALLNSTPNSIGNFLVVLIVVDKIDQINEKQDDKWMEGEECNNIVFWQAVVRAEWLAKVVSTEPRLIYQTLIRGCGEKYCMDI